MAAPRFQKTDIDDFETIDRFAAFGRGEALTPSIILNHCALRWDISDLQKGGNCSDDNLCAQFHWSTAGRRVAISHFHLWQMPLKKKDSHWISYVVIWWLQNASWKY